MVEHVQGTVPRGVEREDVCGVEVGHDDDQAAGPAAPEQGDVEAVRSAVGELGHGNCSFPSGRCDTWSIALSASRSHGASMRPAVWQAALSECQAECQAK